MSHHHHDASRAEGRRALWIVLALTTTFLVVEVIGGLVSDSLALLADAGHMLSDVLSLGVALFASWLAGRPGGPSRTFGYRRAEILAALFNGVSLIAISIWIFIEAGIRFGDPPDVEAGLMLVVAAAGLAVNLGAARILHSHAESSLNVAAAMRHVIADALGSVGAIAAAVIILLTGWEYADPAVSILIGLLILASSWSILRDSLQILLEGSPPGTDVGEVGRAMAATRRRQAGPRPPRLDDHLRLSGACRSRPRRPRDRLPRDAPRARGDAPRALRARPHDPAGRPRGRRAAADRDVIAERDGYELSDDRERLDVDAIWNYLRTAYWSENVPRDVVARAIDGSLCLGLYAPDGAQAGFARAVTDSATFAWIADVFVLEAAPRPRPGRLDDRGAARPPRLRGCAP